MDGATRPKLRKLFLPSTSLVLIAQVVFLLERGHAHTFGLPVLAPGGRSRELRTPRLLLDQGPSEPCYATGSDSPEIDDTFLLAFLFRLREGYEVLFGLFVCLLAYTRKPHGPSLPNFFFACYMWPWLGPPLTALRYSKYFRFYGCYRVSIAWGQRARIKHDVIFR